MRYLYLHGFASGPTSEKAAFLRKRFAEHNLFLETPNLAPGDFSKLTLTSKLAELARTLKAPPTRETISPTKPLRPQTQSIPTNNARSQRTIAAMPPPIATSADKTNPPLPTAIPKNTSPQAANNERRPPAAASRSSGTLVLLGSSLGGYVATLYAHQHPDQVRQLILLAPAFAFPTRWLQNQPAEAVAAWRNSGFHTVYHHGQQQDTQIGYQLVTDAQQYPDYPIIPPKIPILIIHGKNDETVPIASSHHFLKINPHAALIELEADHRLTNPADLEAIWHQIIPLLQ
ncbi:MAG: YqiA/YcfP family alpha/beta fold hydrolase [Verrucomicrobiota bacterium]